MAGAMAIGNERIGPSRFSTWSEEGIAVVAAGTGSLSGGDLALSSILNASEPWYYLRPGTRSS